MVLVEQEALQGVCGAQDPFDSCTHIERGHTIVSKNFLLPGLIFSRLLFRSAVFYFIFALHILAENAHHLLVALQQWDCWRSISYVCGPPNRNCVALSLGLPRYPRSNSSISLENVVCPVLGHGGMGKWIVAQATSTGKPSLGQRFLLAHFSGARVSVCLSNSTAGAEKHLFTLFFDFIQPQPDMLPTS